MRRTLSFLTACPKLPRRVAILGGLLLLPFLSASGQFATVRGLVVDGDDDQPLQGVNVALRSDDGSLMGTSTQGGGLYVLSRIPPGSYSITFSFIGYVSVIDTLAFDFGDLKTINVSLEPDNAMLDDVVVESERRESRSTSIAGFQTIRPSDLERIPVPGLSGDLVSYLNASPGFQAAGDRGGQLFVRGGTPIQNLFLLDGMRVYKPVHIIGLYSAFPADIISYSDIYAGGYGARYGGRLASVVDVTTRNGNKKKVAGSISMAPFLGSGRIEIPVVKDRVSVVASARESLIRDVAPELLDQSLPFRFGDRFFKLHGFINQTSHLSITALRTFDEGDLAGDASVSRNIRWRNEAYGGRFHYLAPSLPVLAQITVSVSKLEVEKLLNEDTIQASRSSGFEGQFNFAYLLGRSEIHFGIFGHSSQFNFSLSPARRDRSEEFVTEGGAFIEGIFKTDRAQVSPGLRFHSFPSRGQVTTEPRLRASYFPFDDRDVSLNMAAGVYHQQIVALTDDRTVSDVFAAWTPSPNGEPVPRSEHLILGVASKPYAWLDASLEVYMMNATNLAFPELGAPLLINNIVPSVDSRSRGIDVSTAVTQTRFFVNVNYSLASVTYDTGSVTFRPPHDRRHQLYINAGTSVKDVRLAIQWQYGSGLPYTPIVGFIDEVNIDDQDLTFATIDGERRIVYAASLSERQPAFHRLDVTAEKTFGFRFAELTLQAGAINVYGRANLFDYDYFSLTRINQLPLIPSVGLRMKTK